MKLQNSPWTLWLQKILADARAACGAPFFSPAAGGAGSGSGFASIAGSDASAAVVSISSSFSSSCSIARSMRSDDWPNASRFSCASSNFSFSASGVLASRPASGRHQPALEFVDIVGQVGSAAHADAIFCFRDRRLPCALRSSPIDAFQRRHIGISPPESLTNHLLSK
jgi:hypothetical protein